MSNTIDEINAYLDAFLPVDVRLALKVRNLRQREERQSTEWKLWKGEALPETPYEWRKINGVTQYRDPDPASPVTSSERPKHKRTGSFAVRRCPDCGEEMFPQPVCPNCAKGKTGLRTQWICGNDSNHFFYTET